METLELNSKIEEILYLDSTICIEINLISQTHSSLSLSSKIEEVVDE